jgi:ribonuclease BN (tRNA processing enzyme)
VTTRREFLGTSAGLLAALPLARAGVQSAKSRLILLGTAGGPTPKPNRAAPSQVIVVNGASYVIDCGNGVARQMILAGLNLGSIRSVFITHQHSDHNADLGTLLLLAWASDLTTKVDVYGPPPTAEMLRTFLRMNDADITTRIADEGRPPLDGLIAPHEIARAGLVMRDANIEVTSAIVNHPPLKPAFAYRFDCPDRSIVISGDTTPSESLVALARDADVLVHEVMHVPSIEKLIATEPNARTLREHLLASHTTTEQVGEVAAKARVKTLVLSHFVPGGYPFVPDATWAEDVRKHFSGRIIVGKDLLEI